MEKTSACPGASIAGVWFSAALDQPSCALPAEPFATSKLVQGASLLAPSATPAATIKWLHAEILRVAEQLDIRERVAQLGLELSVNSPDQFAVLIKTDTAKWVNVIRAANIKAD